MSDNNDSDDFSSELPVDNKFSVSELIGFVKTENKDITGHPAISLDVRTRTCEKIRHSGLSVVKGRPSPNTSFAINGVSKSTDDEDPEIRILKENQGKQKRKRNADPTYWQRQVNQNKRMRGESYLGFTEIAPRMAGPRKLAYGAQRPGRVMGHRCRSNQCKARKDMHCDDFSEEKRKEVFDYFWKQLDWDQKRCYVASLVDTVPVRRRRQDSLMKRTTTNIYCLKLNEVRVQVCQKMFLATLGLGLQQALGWIKLESSGSPKQDTCRKKREPVISERVKHASEFLDKLPKLPSHYCRKSSSKLYLETHLTSKSQLLTLYQNYCEENNYVACSRPQLYKLVMNKNIGIFSPRKDECDMCVGYKNGQVSENEYNLHCQKKNLARDSKSADKSDALAGICHVLTMDLQAVKLSPVLNASSLYYKTKLMSHNFTVYNLKTKEAVCYWWNESEGDLSSSAFTSCITDYIKTYLTDSLPVIIYSDGCVSQNRNHVLGNALLELAISSNRVIIQKFLEKGHTQMECDSVHSVIESALKNKKIFVPDDYINATMKARSENPYVAKNLDFTFFKDFSQKNSLGYSSIRPGIKKGDPCVTDLKNLKYLPEGKIMYKLSYEDKQWKDLPEKPVKRVSVSYRPLYTERKKITSRKFNDLQQLKSVIPTEFHSFYDNLPHD